MIELITTITLLISLMAMAVIVFRKLPALAELSPQEIKGIRVLGRFRDKIKSERKIRALSGGMFLQKALSKIRVLTLKLENKTGSELEKLRQKSIEKKKNFDDGYWQKLRGKK